MTAVLTLDSLEADEGQEITASVTVATDGSKEPHGAESDQLRVLLDSVSPTADHRRTSESPSRDTAKSTRTPSGRGTMKVEHR